MSGTRRGHTTTFQERVLISERAAAVHPHRFSIGRRENFFLSRQRVMQNQRCHALIIAHEGTVRGYTDFWFAYQAG